MSESHLVDGLYSIKDLVDIEYLRKILEKFSAATGFTTGFVSYPEQELLIATGWRDICTKFHRAHSCSVKHCKTSNIALTKQLKSLKELNIMPCENGLVDGATPVIIKGRHVASLATGQILFEKPDLDRFRKRAEEYGYDPDEYLAALAEVPVVSEEQMKSALSFLSEMAVMIAELGLANLKAREDAVKLEREVAERRRTEKALRESENKYRTLFQCTAEGILVADLEEKKFRYANPAICQMLGYREEELLGMGVDDIHSAEDLPHVIDEFELQARGEKTLASRIPCLRKDGTKIYMDINTAMVVMDGVRCNVGFFGDVTERERAEEETRRRQQQLVQIDKMAALGTLVAGIAHEINNPNSFITYNIPLLEESWLIFEPILAAHAEAHPDWQKNGVGFSELCQDMREIIRDIKTGSKRINKVVSNLKDFARLDESIHTRPIQVNKVIESGLTIVGAQVRKSAGKISVNLADNLPEIQGHFQKLEQVLINLVINATQAIPAQTRGTLSIGTRYVERLRCVLIEVEDNGAGIPPEVRDRLFDPFFTTRRDSGGTGLGLSVSYGLIQEHGGIIGVLSRPGSGTRFTVFLPINRDIRLDLRPQLLCVADTPPPVFGMLNAHLRKQNSSVEFVRDRENALHYMAGHPEVDVVLADTALPDGREFIERIKGRHRLLTIIGYSSRAESSAAGTEYGALLDHFLQNPADMSELLESLESVPRQKL